MRNRVEFVIVTTGTIHGESEHRLRSRGHQILKMLLPRYLLHRLRTFMVPHLVPRSADMKSRRDERIEPSRINDIARNLESQKFIVRKVRIESPDDPIAVAPGIFADPVSFKSLTLAKAHHVQPTAPPTLPKRGRC